MGRGAWGVMREGGEWSEEREWRHKTGFNRQHSEPQSSTRPAHSPRTTPHASFKIGIAWQGNPIHKKDKRRSMPLSCFEPLARLEGVHLFSLQKGTGSEQLAQLAGRFPITDLGSRLETFVDTAAVLKNLDLVIACDTAIVHLAGALAVPVWAALAYVPDWRWLLEREDSPWYPTLRLFRQKRWGDWDEVFQRIVQALRKLRKDEG